MTARVKQIDAPRPEDTGAPSTANLAVGDAPPLPPPYHVEEEALDLVAALVRERSLTADDDDLKRMAGELLAAGHSVERTGVMLGLRPATVWAWMGDPLLRQAKRAGVEYVRARVFEEMLGGTLASVQALTRIVDNPLADSDVKLKIFEALADRTGFGKPDRKGGERQVIDVTFSRRLAEVAGGVRVESMEEDGAEEDEEGSESETG